MHNLYTDLYMICNIYIPLLPWKWWISVVFIIGFSVILEIPKLKSIPNLNEEWKHPLEFWTLYDLYLEENYEVALFKRLSELTFH